MNRTVIGLVLLVVGLGLAGAMWFAIQGDDPYSVVTYGIGLLACLAISQLVGRKDRPMRRQDG